LREKTPWLVYICDATMKTIEQSSRITGHAGLHKFQTAAKRKPSLQTDGFSAQAHPSRKYNSLAENDLSRPAVPGMPLMSM
jgi:hypothetical protein